MARRSHLPCQDTSTRVGTGTLQGHGERRTPAAKEAERCPNPLKYPQEVDAFSAVYQVVRTVVVVMDEQTYRIEVLKGYANVAAPYIARCWVQQHVTVSPTAPAMPRKGARKDET